MCLTLSSGIKKKNRKKFFLFGLFAKKRSTAKEGFDIKAGDDDDDDDDDLFLLLFSTSISEEKEEELGTLRKPSWHTREKKERKLLFPSRSDAYQFGALFFSLLCVHSFRSQKRIIKSPFL